MASSRAAGRRRRIGIARIAAGCRAFENRCRRRPRESGNADDRCIDRADIARHDRDVASDDDRVDRSVTAGSMRTAAGDGNVEIGAARHHRTGSNLELADRQPRPVVHPENRVTREALEQAVGKHFARNDRCGALF